MKYSKHLLYVTAFVLACIGPSCSREDKKSTNPERPSQSTGDVDEQRDEPETPQGDGPQVAGQQPQLREILSLRCQSQRRSSLRVAWTYHVGEVRGV